MKSKRRLAGLVLVIWIIPLLFLPVVRAASSTIPINALYYDTYFSSEPDEAFELTNLLPRAINAAYLGGVSVQHTTANKG